MSNPEITTILRERQLFENQTFDKVINEVDFNFEGDLEFKNCVFEKPISIDNFKTNGKLTFFNCKFSSYSVIKNSELDIISILGCEFSGSDKSTFSLLSNKCNILSLDGFKGNLLKINGKYLLSFINQCTFKKLLLKDINTEYSQSESRIEFKRNNEIENLNIESSNLFSDLIFDDGTYESIHFDGVFKNSIVFKGALKTKYLFFESSTLHKRLDIEDGFFTSINFYRSNFQGLIWINGYNLLDNTSLNLSIKELSLHECVFDKNITLNSSKINSLSLSNNNFKQLLNFNTYQKIDGNVNENKINISISGINQGSMFFENINTNINLSGINFGNINFKNINIKHLTISDFQNKGVVSFNNIKSGDLLIITDSIVGNLDFMGSDVTLFKEFVFSDSNLVGINFSKHPFNILSYSSNPVIGYGIIDKSKWNTNLKNVYNQLKKNALLKGDIDTSMKYQSLEYKYLLKEKDFGFDKVLLFLNLISNKNGLSWFRGILFTLITAYLFMLLYLKTINIDFNFEESLKDYTFFISSFPKLEIQKYSTIPNTWQSNLVIWISRIFVSYGIYQTIAAFRKYGKS
ncbi:hypothetical protein [Flavobacterium difficile]|uniref:Pentapeptide repeat-containing protein n=1 Tax=Flavobacterium difficile TaxID=2709659 RepID=A0ABX0I3D5_9FLAO|nr:hypothetical protein [Flavobacterium difficile]NHM01687.1 hypothetical protein [Flavobacterium difficile]